MGRTRSNKNRHLLPRLHQKKGRWYYVAKGKWTPLGGDYGEALRKWAELEQSNLPTGRLFDDLAREFALRVVPKWSAKSQGGWPFWLAALTDSFSGVHLEDIDATHVYGHVEKREREKRRASGLRERSVLSSMLGAAVRWGWLKANPALGVRIAQEPPRDRYLTDAEYQRIHAKASEPVRLAMELGYLTGLRIGDLLKLRRDDITDEGLFVRQDKNRVQGLYAVTPEMKAILARAKLLRKNSEWILSRRGGKLPYKYSGFRMMWDRAVEASKVQNVHFHDIRAKAATDAKAAGRDVQSFTLHKTREMADRYVKAHEIQRVEPISMRSKMVRK